MSTEIDTNIIKHIYLTQKRRVVSAQKKLTVSIITKLADKFHSKKLFFRIA